MRVRQLLVKFKSSFLIFTLIATGFFGCLIFDGLMDLSFVEASKIIVDHNGQGNYTKIQDAINAANSGDYIYVWAGSYYEHIVIDKKLSLIGNGTNVSIIDGGASNNVVLIIANNVEFNGFLVTGSGRSWDWEPKDKFSGINLKNVSNCIIKNNMIMNNQFGISINNLFSKNNFIENNVALKNEYGIYVKSPDNIIRNNTCSHNIESGIFVSVSDSFIINNTCNYNDEGISLYLSNSNTIKNNKCLNNSCGLYVFDSKFNYIEDNILNSNNGCGIQLNYGSSYNNLSNNECCNNTRYGIEIRSDNNTIINNTIKLNFIGVEFSEGFNSFINNNCSLNEYYGLEISSNSNIVKNNIFYNKDCPGIYLRNSRTNHISNNKMFSCSLMIKGDYGSDINFWNSHIIDKSNTVNGNPIYYWKNINGGKVPEDAGEIILVNCSNILIDNQNLNGGTYGILIGFCNNIIIKNNNCNYNSGNGIYIYSSNSNLIYDNNFNFNKENGIYLNGKMNIIEKNEFISNLNGIHIEGGLNNTIINNTLKFSFEYGIKLESNGNKLNMNSMIGCGLYVDYYLGSCNSHTIDISNTVNEKPIYYWKNKNGGIIPNGAGEIILANCENITIKNQNLSNGSIGIILRHSNNNIINNNKCNGNTIEGIAISGSDNKIIKNECNHNKQNGVYKGYSGGITVGGSNNLLENNTCNSNLANGISIHGPNNFFINNTISNNYDGITIYFSINNTFYNNKLNFCGFVIEGDYITYLNTHTITSNNTINGKPVYYWKNKNGGKIPSNAGMVILIDCSNITIENINIHNSSFGIRLIRSHDNIIKNNICNSNTKYGLFLSDSDRNMIKNNRFNSNELDGIKLSAGKSNNFTFNICNYNKEYGMNLYSAFENKIENNQLLYNNIGLSLSSGWGSQRNNHNQQIYSNSERYWGYGNIISHNYLSNNNEGIRIYSSMDGNKFILNHISNNIYGVYFIGGETYNQPWGNEFYFNNFISNEYQVIDKFQNFWWNYTLNKGNYWSDYKGQDNGAWNRDLNDGVGDTFLKHLFLDYCPLLKLKNWTLPPFTPILNYPGEYDNDGNYTISWERSKDSSAFIFEEDTDINFQSPEIIYHGSNTSWKIKNKNNNTFFYRVKTYNDFGQSNWSNIVKIIVDWPPNVPNQLSIQTDPYGNVLNITWEPNKIDTKEYHIECKNVSNNVWKKIGTIEHPNHTFNHTGLNDGEKYFYRIQSCDVRGQLSNFSDIVEGIPFDSISPSAPFGLSIKYISNNSIEIEWKPNNEKDVIGYNIYRNNISNPLDWDKPIGSTFKGFESYIDENLTELSTYYYVIAAFDEVPNESIYSNLVSGTTTIGQYGPEINNSIFNLELKEDNIDNSSINLFSWFKDKNNDPLFFKCTGQNHIKVQIFQKNGTVILIPELDWNGEETLTFIASDGFSNISDNIILIVTPINDPPGLIKIISPEDNYTVYNNTTINFSAICEDPDLAYGDILEFNWSSNLTGEFGKGKDLNDVILPVGQHQITINVTDLAGKYSIDILNITILDVPKPPPNNTKDNITENDKPLTSEKETNESNIILIIITLILLIIIIVIISFVIIKKKKIFIKKDSQAIPKETYQFTPKSDNTSKLKISQQQLKFFSLAPKIKQLTVPLKDTKIEVSPKHDLLPTRFIRPLLPPKSEDK